MTRLDDYNYQIEREVKTLFSISTTPSKKILVVATPRTASGYFCDLLQTHFSSNTIHEFFSPNLLSWLIPKLNTTIDEYISNLMRGEVFIAKCMLHHYAHWIKEGVDLTKYFDKIVYIRRDDSIAQARSSIIARKRSFWLTWSSEGWGADKARKENDIDDYTPSDEEIASELLILKDHLSWLSDMPIDLEFEFTYIIDDDHIDQIIKNCQRLFND